MEGIYDICNNQALPRRIYQPFCPGFWQSTIGIPALFNQPMSWNLLKTQLLCNPAANWCYFQEAQRERGRESCPDAHFPCSSAIIDDQCKHPANIGLIRHWHPFVWEPYSHTWHVHTRHPQLFNRAAMGNFLSSRSVVTDPKRCDAGTTWWWMEAQGPETAKVVILASGSLGRSSNWWARKSCSHGYGEL